MLRVIMKSKYFRVTLLCVLIVDIALATGVYFLLQGSSLPEEKVEVEALLEGKADVVIGGEHLEDIRIVDGEKGIFAVKHVSRDEYWLTNTEGEKADSQTYEAIGEKDHGYLEVYDGAWQVLDVDTLEMVLSTGYKEMNLNGEEKYVTGTSVEPNGDVRYEVRGFSGEVLYTGEAELFPTENPGYVIEGDSPGNKVIRLEDKAVMYEAKPFETVVEGKGGFWKIFYEETWKDVGGTNTFTCEYALDEEFQIACEGQLWSNMYLTDDAVVGTAYTEEIYWNSIEKAKTAKWFTVATRVYFYDEDKGDGELAENLCGVVGNYLVVSGDECKHHRYYDLHKKYYGYSTHLLTDIESGEGLCCMSFEDGYSPACVARYSWDGSAVVGNPSMDIKENSERKWTYMDGNMKPITGYVFNSVSLVENGYGVVAIEEGVFLVDFRQRARREGA